LRVGFPIRIFLGGLERTTEEIASGSPIFGELKMESAGEKVGDIWIFFGFQKVFLEFFGLNALSPEVAVSCGSWWGGYGGADFVDAFGNSLASQFDSFMND
jgi:hypothetical protein